MIKLFQSKYKAKFEHVSNELAQIAFRVDGKICTLESELLRIKAEQSCISSANSTEQARLICRKKEIEHDVELLNGILK